MSKSVFIVNIKSTSKTFTSIIERYPRRIPDAIPSDAAASLYARKWVIIGGLADARERSLDISWDISWVSPLAEGEMCHVMILFQRCDAAFYEAYFPRGVGLGVLSVARRCGKLSWHTCICLVYYILPNCIRISNFHRECSAFNRNKDSARRLC